MMPWFIWNGKSSYSDFGLWVSKLPNITRANERYEEITIPGKPGTLIVLEGEDVYESYVKECVVTLPSDRNIEPILGWLRGSGEVIFSNEREMVYTGRIAAEVSFERDGNSFLTATIPFFVEPYKKRTKTETITITTSGTIINPGDVASRPLVTVSGGSSVTIAGQEMSFSGSGTLLVDCDAHIVTKGGELFTDGYTGEFWKIPTGASAVTGNCTIDPRWRWV